MKRFGLTRATQIICAIIVAACLREAAAADSPKALPHINLDNNAISKETKLATSFAPIIKKAASSVVNVFSSRTVKDDPRMLPFFNDPMLRRFFGAPQDEEEPGNPTPPPRGRRSTPRSRQEQSLGSGVIVSSDGYIMTNNHVVEGADEVNVETSSGQKFTAKIIGTDPATDTAVLKVDAKDLPAVTIANSDQLEVGDTVLAIGNPFGLGQTVTMGIVSAIGRGSLGIVDYEDFIQTDASINPGNSGGALIDAEGRLVGINSAILSRTGGNQGVGFAVPVNMARGVLERLIEYGKVSRGFLGVQLQELTPEFSKAFNVPDQNGVLVGRVLPKGPGAQAGIKKGDVIVEFNDKKVSDPRHLRLMVSQTPPKSTVTLKILRDGNERTLHAKLGELPNENLASSEGKNASPESDDSDALNGVEVTDLDAKARRQFAIPADVQGALVANVDPDSTSYAAGLRPGDVVMEIGKKTIENAEDAVELSKKLKQDTILLYVWSKGGGKYLLVDETKHQKKPEK